jgi:hypothetical protein
MQGATVAVAGRADVRRDVHDPPGAPLGHVARRGLDMKNAPDRLTARTLQQSLVSQLERPDERSPGRPAPLLREM